MKKILLAALLALCAFPLPVFSQTASYPETQLNPAYGTDTGSANVLTVPVMPACFSSYLPGAHFWVKPGHQTTSTTPTISICGLATETIVKSNGGALVSGDMNTGQIALLVWDGTNMELINPLISGTGTVTSIGTTGPITGGTITGSGTIACPTCVTSAASLGSGNLMTGAGSQASQTNANISVSTGGLFTVYDGLTTAGLGVEVIQGTVSDVTSQTASQTSVNLITSTAAAGHYTVHFYMDQNATCSTPGSGNVYATVSWTDATHAHTAATVPLTFGSSVSTTTGYVEAAIPLWSATASAISYTTTYTACGTGTASYDLHAYVEQGR